MTRRGRVAPPQGPALEGRSDLGQALRAARRQHGLSQLELALRTGISQRHLGFIEVGRSRPSRGTLTRLLEELRPSQALMNAALLHAGYSADGLGSGAAAQLDLAVRQMVEAHFPFPAIVFDAEWHIRWLNPGASWLFAQIMPNIWVSAPSPLDMIALIASPDGILSKAKNPRIAASTLLSQIQAEAWATPSLRERLELCATALRERYGPLPECPSKEASPALSITFDTAHGELSYFSVQMVPGLPQNVSLETLRVELCFPADAATRAVMAREVSRDDAAGRPELVHETSCA